MRTVLRTAIATAVASMTLAAPALADTATSDLLLARNACGASDGVAPDPRLAFSVGASTGGCGSLLAIAGGSTTNYPAKEGVPVTLDVSRPITVEISISSYLGLLVGGVGPEKVEVVLTGRKNKKWGPIAQGTYETPADEMLTNAEYIAQFEFPLTAAHTGEYTDLNLALKVGGSQFSGFVSHDGSSYVSLPVFDPPAEEEPTDEEL